MITSIKVDLDFFKGKYPKVIGRGIVGSMRQAGELVYRAEALIEELAASARAEGDWRQEKSDTSGEFHPAQTTLTIFGAGAEGQDVVYTADNANGVVEQRYGGSDKVVWVIDSHPAIDDLLVECGVRQSEFEEI